MAPPREKQAHSIPPFLLAAGSAVIVAHFGVVIAHALAVPSGPWPGPEGQDMAAPPAFVKTLNQEAQGYRYVFRLGPSDSVAGDPPAFPGVFAEVRLKDSGGNVIKTVRLPDPDANAWVRHREELLVQGLVPDQPIMPPRGESIPAPNQEVRKVPIWQGPEGGPLRLQHVPEHLIPRQRDVMGPTERSLVLVRSYARHLCRQHGASSAEVLRHSREAISPIAYLMGPPPPMAFTDLIVSYGDISGE
jgi:hypothetical protein